MLSRRIGMRIAERLRWLWGLLSAPWVWARYHWQMFQLGASEREIDHVFTEMMAIPLPQDMLGEWLSLSDSNIDVFFLGNELQIRVHGGGPIPLYHFSLKQSYTRQLYVEEWHPIPREVTLEHGFKGKTNWHEVYRSGRYIKSTQWIPYLRRLMEKPPCPSPARNSAASSSPPTPSDPRPAQGITP